MNLLLLLSTIFTLLKQEVLSYPTDVSENNVILKPLGGLGEMLENFVGGLIGAKTLTSNFPDSGRRQAVLELEKQESLPIQLDMKYGQVQGFVADIFNPKPIVDMTEEYEKYGNDGGKGRKVGTAIVGAFEALSNGLNAIAELPSSSAKAFGKKITSSLNVVGDKLVGLSK